MKRTLFVGSLLTVFWIVLSGCIKGDQKENSQPELVTFPKRIQFNNNKLPSWLTGVWKVTTNVSPGITAGSRIKYIYVKSVNTNDLLLPFMTNGYVLEGVAIMTNNAGKYARLSSADPMYINDRMFYFGTINPLEYNYEVSADLNAVQLFMSGYRLELIKITNNVEIQWMSNIVRKIGNPFENR